MFQNIVEFFIPVQEDKSTEYRRRVRLIAYAVFLTMIFALFYIVVSLIAGYKPGLLIMLASWFGYLILLLLLKARFGILGVANLFGFIGATSIYGSIYFSGGFESPVLPWLASTPIVLLLIAGKRSGFFWAAVSVIMVLTFGFMDHYGYVFPNGIHASKETYFTLSSQTGLILIIFFISIVFENIRKSAFGQVNKQKEKLEETLFELRSTQAQLIHSEKMASLGELTAGIAHEIQNPLNFVNNFSEVTNELIDEMKEELTVGNIQLVNVLMEDIKQNLNKINHHGQRADAIVKGMLQHSRTNNGAKELTDINVLAEEYLKLSYYGLRAKEKSFNAEFQTELDEFLPKVYIVPQDIGRVLLNLINNAFYAVDSEDKKGINGYQPKIVVSTRKQNDWVEIKISDNGVGISADIKDKIFNPFFTTKPTGQGTGLGLSISYDIVKAHGGELKVDSFNNKGASFILTLPVSIKA